MTTPPDPQTTPDAAGTFTLPTRVYLTAAQRATLLAHVRDEGGELADLLTALLTSYLALLPPGGTPADAPAGTATATSDDSTDTAAARRAAELAYLRERATQGGEPLPPWLAHYLAQQGDPAAPPPPPVPRDDGTHPA